MVSMYWIDIQLGIYEEIKYVTSVWNVFYDYANWYEKWGSLSFICYIPYLVYVMDLQIGVHKIF